MGGPGAVSVNVTVLSGETVPTLEYGPPFALPRRMSYPVAKPAATAVQLVVRVVALAQRHVSPVGAGSWPLPKLGTGGAGVLVNVAFAKPAVARAATSTPPARATPSARRVARRVLPSSLEPEGIVGVPRDRAQRPQGAEPADQQEEDTEDDEGHPDAAPAEHTDSGADVGNDVRGSPRDGALHPDGPRVGSVVRIALGVEGRTVWSGTPVVDAVHHERVAGNGRAEEHHIARVQVVDSDRLRDHERALGHTRLHGTGEHGRHAPLPERGAARDDTEEEGTRRDDRGECP